MGVFWCTYIPWERVITADKYELIQLSNQKTSNIHGDLFLGTGSVSTSNSTKIKFIGKDYTGEYNKIYEFDASRVRFNFEAEEPTFTIRSFVRYKKMFRWMDNDPKKREWSSDLDWVYINIPRSMIQDFISIDVRK